jgi:hypothetical protein
MRRSISELSNHFDRVSEIACGAHCHGKSTASSSGTSNPRMVSVLIRQQTDSQRPVLSQCTAAARDRLPVFAADFTHGVCSTQCRKDASERRNNGVQDCNLLVRLQWTGLGANRSLAIQKRTKIMASMNPPRLFPETLKCKQPRQFFDRRGCRYFSRDLHNGPAMISL